MRTEIFVSTDNLNFTKLDLLKDENIIIKYVRKDTKEISKVFAPYSNGFSIDATEKNMIALGFFGKSEMIRLAGSDVLNCKIYINGFLNNIGLLKIEGVKYLDGKASSFNVSFNSSVLSLKDRIGDDKINDLAQINVPYNFNDVYNSIQQTQIIDDVKYYTPLISNNRVWQYSANNNDNDNIFYKSLESPSSDKVIQANELRPAISLLSLFDLIRTKYNLSINLPIQRNREFKDAYIWCNGTTKSYAYTREKIIILNQFESVYLDRGDPPTYLYIELGANLGDSAIIYRTNVYEQGSFNVVFNNLKVLSVDTNPTITLSLVRKSDGLSFSQRTVALTNGNLAIGIGFSETYLVPILPPNDPLLIDYELEFYIYVETSFGFSYDSVNVQCMKFLSNGDITSNSFSNNNLTNNLQNFSKVNLIKGLPPVKVIDFLTSIIKTFNISIFDSSLNNENLDFLTPIDINDIIEPYGKSEVDYTRFADLKKVDKKTIEDVTYYNFKHKTSKYKSNVDFKNQFGKEYGQTTYPAIKPPKAKEFIVETSFSILPPVMISGANNIITAYGFNDKQPKIEGTFFRYEPNYDELTIFYKGEPTIIPALGCQDLNSAGVLVNSPLTYYQPSTPFNLVNGVSLGFSILVHQNTSYPSTLYSNYYSEQTQLLLNPNTLENSISLNLPPNEIYLNETEGFKPQGFRLQNDVIISENKYEVLSLEINIINGDVKGKFLNK